MDAGHNEKALSIADRLFPDRGRKRLEMLEGLDPGFCRLFEDFAYGGLYARQVLDDRMRELCIVAGLTVLSRPSQLATHVRAARLAGATREEVQEVMFQMAAIAGLPATLAALDEMVKVFTD